MIALRVKVCSTNVCIRGVSRISARGVLKVRPHTKSGGGGGGKSTSGPIYEKWGGGGGGEAVHFRSHIRKVGGGQSTSGPIYEKWGGGAVHIRSDIRKVGGGGGGAIRFRSDTFVWHTENTLSLIINGYNFDQGGGGAQALHTRARMNLSVVINCIHSLIVFICETEGGARAP